MCTAISGGGQRCSAHTRPLYLSARENYDDLLHLDTRTPEAETEARKELFEAASNYATTSEGINALLEELAGERYQDDDYAFLDEKYYLDETSYSELISSALREGGRKRAITDDIKRAIAYEKLEEANHRRESSEALEVAHGEQIGDNFVESYTTREENVGLSPWQVYEGIMQAMQEENIYKAPIIYKVSMPFPNEKNKKLNYFGLGIKKAAREYFINATERYSPVALVIDSKNESESPEENSSRLREIDEIFEIASRERMAGMYVESAWDLYERGVKDWDVYKEVVFHAKTEYANTVWSLAKRMIRDPRNDQSVFLSDEESKAQAKESPTGKEARFVFLARRKAARSYLFAKESGKKD